MASSSQFQAAGAVVCRQGDEGLVCGRADQEERDVVDGVQDGPEVGRGLAAGRAARSPRGDRRGAARSGPRRPGWHRRAIGTAAALLLAGTTALVGSAGPASACSFSAPTLDAPREAQAGGTLRVAGTNYFRIEGDVGSMCDGDYRTVPLDGVQVQVTFATLSGNRSLTVPAAVHADFTIGPIPIPVPVDATEAAVTIVDPRSFAPNRALVLVLGASPTTTAPPATTATGSGDGTGGATPATPVPGAAGYTG